MSGLGFQKGYASESESQEALLVHLQRLEDGGYVKIYREVRGYYCATRPGCEQKGARIDFMLQPLAKLKALGWRSMIGIECKRSDGHIGKTVCQAIDYTYAVFRAGDTYLYPEFLFIWPMMPVNGDVESIMVQNRIGTVSPVHSGIRFKLGGTNLITTDGPMVYARPSEECTAGRKTGSR